MMVTKRQGFGPHFAVAGQTPLRSLEASHLDISNDLSLEDEEEDHHWCRRKCRARHEEAKFCLPLRSEGCKILLEHELVSAGDGEDWPHV